MKYLVRSNTGESEILGQLAYIGHQAGLLKGKLLKRLVFAVLLNGYLRRDSTLTAIWETDDTRGTYASAVYDDTVYIESGFHPGILVGVPVLMLVPTVGVTVAKSANLVSHVYTTQDGLDGSTLEQLWGLFAELVSKEHALYCCRVFYDFSVIASTVEEMGVLQEAPKDDGLDEWADIDG